MNKQMQVRLDQINRLANKAGILGLVGVASLGSAHAVVDVTAVTDAMTAAGVAIATVGLAYLAVKVGIKVWPWVASAMGR